MNSAERAWRRAREELHRGLTGDVLEIGPGTDPTLPVRGTWIGIEPSAGRVRRLERTVAGRGGLRADVVTGRAEQLPVPGASIDVVVSTWVLCSVDDQAAAMREARRVLRPGGRLILCEHVGAEPGTLVHAVQRAAAPITRALDHGCDPSRQTRRSIDAAGFGSDAIGVHRPGRWATVLVGSVER